MHGSVSRLTTPLSPQCDLQHPTCGQCSKAKLACGGYERQRIFINATSTCNICPAGPSEVALQPSLTRSAYKDKYFSLFWDIYLGVPIKEASECLSRFPIGSWRSIAKDLHHQDNLAKKAVLAMALSTIGRKNDESWMMREGLKLCVSALGEARAGLRHPTKWKADSLLLACSAFGMFEVRCPPCRIQRNFDGSPNSQLLYGAETQSQAVLSQARSWHGHAIGELALIQQRSPALHIEGFAHRLFVNSRIHLVCPLSRTLTRSFSETEFLQQTIAACCARTRTPLAEPAWKTIPWSKFAKTPKDKLVDVFVDIPGLLEDADRLRENPTDQLYQRLMADYKRIDVELISWLQNQAPAEHLRSLQAKGYTNPTAEDLAVVQIMSLSWAMSILAYSTMLLAGTLNPSSAPPRHFPPHTNPRQYCNFIADIVEVLLQPEAGIFGVQAVPFPVGTALEYLVSTEGYGSDTSKKLVGYFTQKGLGASIGSFIMSSRKEWMDPRTGVSVK